MLLSKREKTWNAERELINKLLYLVKGIKNKENVIKHYLHNNEQYSTNSSF